MKMSLGRCLAMVTLIFVLPESGDAGINDGTLPLLLMGQAVGLQADQANNIAATIQFKSVDPVSLERGQGFKCRSVTANQTRHIATGSISVGLKRFPIKGVCITEAQGRQKIEIMSQNRSTEARLTGFFTETRGRKLVTGRLQVTQTGGRAERFQIKVRSNIEQTREPRRHNRVATESSARLIE